MGERTQHTPGTFSWADVSTMDQPAAKEFYIGLFGWEADDRPVGDGVVYSMMHEGGKDVAAVSPQPQQQREAGFPPLWNSYVTVASADESAAKAKELGATLHAPPFDVMDVGRMAVIEDPQGAFFMIWEPRSNIGAQLVNGPGRLSWNELATPDVDASVKFYGDLFGWTSQDMEGMPQRYVVVQNGGRANGGIREQSPDEQGPGHWLVYLGIDDIDAGLAKVEELGGRKLAGPIDIGIAKIGIVQDPQGATFALYDGEFED